MRRPDVQERMRREHPSRRFYENADWMRNRYHEDGLTLREIADQLDVGLRTVARWMTVHGIPRPSAYQKAMLRGGSRHAAGNPNWRGGLPTCKSCGCQVARGNDRCQGCYDRSGSLNPNWRGIADAHVLIRQGLKWWRKAVFKRDGYTCQDCGDARGGNLHAHHICYLSNILADLAGEWGDPPVDAHGRTEWVARALTHPCVRDLGNGVTVCESCHRIRHGYKQTEGAS